MTCGTCINWQIVPGEFHNSDRSDKQMQELGFKNCTKLRERFASAHFFHAMFEAKDCSDYEAKKV